MELIGSRKDYDCFYASVFENENPALKSVPLAVQQKQIIVTCNYAARRLGLRKLQLATEAKKIVPDLVIVLGEKLDRFREASKNLYRYLRSYSWNGKVERLGFDEVFLDVTDIIDYNQALLNQRNLKNSFFFLDPLNPTRGFQFDATTLPDCVFPNHKNFSRNDSVKNDEEFLLTRLTLGSNLAQFLRLQLENEKGFTSSVGISTNKLLSKLVGNLNKPNGQTTLVPPYDATLTDENSSYSNVTKFIDDFDIGKIPGIGFKSAQYIRNHILSRTADFDTGLIYGETREKVSVYDVKAFPGMGPSLLEYILGGPGAKRGIGGKIWSLLNGIDDDEVKQAKDIPTQISIENSYLCLDSTSKLLQELQVLAMRLLSQIHIDLLEENEDPDAREKKRWIAWPRTIRISTRSRSTCPAETRTRDFSRTSRSSSLPNFVFNLTESLESTVKRLVRETLTPLIHKLHPDSSSMNISLVNICVTNMQELACKDSMSKVRSISRMFETQKSSSILQEVGDQGKSKITRQSRFCGNFGKDISLEDEDENGDEDEGNEPKHYTTSMSYQEIVEESESDTEFQETCDECGTVMPGFALVAHKRFHQEDC
ncbi:hypothetical protein K3495_g11104 [Podosphaera aphanis]|nr:hypothetical protein K3495_g11104 [Podosphaera aphanis]